jgi:hypothetical protein
MITTSPTQMRDKPVLKPIEKEVHRLHQAGKSPDTIAIRIGMKMSRVLSILNPTAVNPTGKP